MKPSHRLLEWGLRRRHLAFFVSESPKLPAQGRVFAGGNPTAIFPGILPSCYEFTCVPSEKKIY